MAVFVPPGWLFPVLGAVTLIGMSLLAVTPGFRWAELLAGARRMNWTLILGTVLGTLIVGYGIISLTEPDARFTLVRYNLPLMAMIALLYPFLSALPQEIVFRPLFFRRYQPILPRRANPAILLNAAIFSFAHLMYWSWIVAAMTFAGGLVFAYSYRVRGNFPEAVVAHALAGIAIFALGLGVFFYSGNVTRPF
ncbi:MAG: CPBP family intramembrane metalloprotease [Silicimonas sp.]|nr:CPBP family intramembrane metalloprotease [Silicimonas sp.]